jgi:leucyl aminopeptidase
MKISFADRRPDDAQVLVLPAASAKDESVAAMGGSLSAALDRQRFKGESGDIVEHIIDKLRVIVIGLPKGKRDGADAERIGGSAIARLLMSGESKAVIDLSMVGADADFAARVGLAAELRAWRYDLYRTKLKPKDKPTLKEVVIVGGGKDVGGLYAKRWKPVAEGVALTREVVTEPANIIYPESFVERVKASVEGMGLTLNVLNRAEMEKLGMGALLGVAQGSVREARMLILEWKGGGDANPVAFVGKGVTFDTGGISIKPAQGMESMKWDMGGAGAVVGAMKALAGRKAKANVVGICGLVENMPGGNAQRPGDVVTTMSGQTVEVINTDAEGRLVLGDALTYLQANYKSTAIIDLATLTGAILISLGHEYAGLFANDEKLAGQLLKAGEETGDKLWRMPMGEVFDRMIDSPIADMKNVGPREAGSITAAQFILRFVETGNAWAHIDMAGKAWADKASSTYDKGATGYGVRLLDQFVADVVEV